MNVIGNGVVLDPAALFKEIDDLAARGIAVTPANLRISYKTHLVMPYHMEEDAAREGASVSGAIGTTRRGIGPAYADKMQRSTAVRVADLTDEERLKHRIHRIVTERNQVLQILSGCAPLDWQPIFETYRDFGRRMQPYVDDTTFLLLNYAREGKRIVFEGAHAALLDVDHGTYPYVTSSSCSALGVYTGSGVPPQMVQNFIGVIKAYSTRVGGGPFPTEQDNQTGNYIRERGNEYGTTTRRPRRCGWFDAVAVRLLGRSVRREFNRHDPARRPRRTRSPANLHGLQISRRNPPLFPRRRRNARRGRAHLRNPSRLARRCRQMHLFRSVTARGATICKTDRASGRRAD